MGSRIMRALGVAGAVLALVLVGLVTGPASASAKGATPTTPSAGQVFLPGQYKVISPATKNQPGVIEAIPGAKPAATVNAPTGCNHSGTSLKAKVTAGCTGGSGKVAAAGRFYDPAKGSWYPAGAGTNPNLYAYSVYQPIGVLATLTAPSSAYTTKYGSYALTG